MYNAGALSSARGSEMQVCAKFFFPERQEFAWFMHKTKTMQTIVTKHSTQ